MTTIAIRLPDLEAVMRVVVQKVNKAYRDLQGLPISRVQQEYVVTLVGGPHSRSSTLRWS